MTDTDRELVKRLNGIVAAKPPHVTVLADNVEVYPIRADLLREAAAAISRLPTERDEAQNGCPCTIVEPCRSSCTCANPLMSGGCDRCARYGNEEQRIAAATRLVRLDRERDEMENMLLAVGNIVGGPTMAYAPTMFLYLLPRRWWLSVNWPYFSIGVWVISFGRLVSNDG